MKKLLLSLGLVFMAAGATMAQEQGSIRLGAGLVYGTKAGINDKGEVAGKLGINVGGEYFFTEQISAAPSFTYFLPSTFDEDGGKESFTFSSLNLDGRYYFGDGDIAFYGLAGISVGFASYKLDVDSEYEDYVDDESTSSSDTGINLGAGLVYPINDKLGLNGQIKYNTPFEQLAIQGGITFTIK